MSNITEQIAVLGSSVNLNSGAHLRSNPSASVHWYNPNGKQIEESDDIVYNLDDGPDIVQLNISHVSERDSGLWNCTIVVSDSNVYSVDGRGILGVENGIVEIGSVSKSIWLIVLSECT